MSACGGPEFEEAEKRFGGRPKDLEDIRFEALRKEEP